MYSCTPSGGRAGGCRLWRVRGRNDGSEGALPCLEISDRGDARLQVEAAGKMRLRHDAFAAVLCLGPRLRVSCLYLVLSLWSLMAVAVTLSVTVPRQRAYHGPGQSKRQPVSQEPASATFRAMEGLQAASQSGGGEQMADRRPAVALSRGLLEGWAGRWANGKRLWINGKCPVAEGEIDNINANAQGQGRPTVRWNDNAATRKNKLPPEAPPSPLQTRQARSLVALDVVSTHMAWHGCPLFLYQHSKLPPTHPIFLLLAHPPPPSLLSSQPPSSAHPHHPIPSPVIKL